MIDSLYIAWKYIAHSKIKSATLIACITLILILPMALELLLNESQRQLLSRADTTSFLVGAKGSAHDLTMSTLYFHGGAPELISMAAVREVAETKLATAIPVYARFYARGFPIIGTSLDYFDLRSLNIESGRQLALLGECVIGAQIAKRLKLTTGDSLVSSPETVFDIAGVYPLKMKVVGVLERSFSPDDLAIFVDLKTAWTIQGLGHGHEDLEKTRDTSIIMERGNKNAIASAKLTQFTEITESNMDEFHFHGNTDIYPITSVIAVPNDVKSGTILRGRYIEQSSLYLAVNPKDVIADLLENIFHIKNILSAIIVFVGTATLLAMILVFALSLRLRQGEIDTIFNLGCSRFTITRLLVAEIAIILLACGVNCALLLILINNYSHDLVRILFIR